MINILLHVCTTVCLFIHLLTDICVVSTFLLLLNSAKYFPAMIWVPVLNLGVIYLGVEFLGHMDIFEKSRNWTFKQCLQEICFFSPKEMAEISENWVGGFGGDSTMCYVNVLIQASVRSGEGNGTPLQYSCLENRMDRGAWWAAVHGVAKRHDWATSLSCIEEGNGNSLQLFLSGESQGRGSLVGCRLWGRTESDTTEATQQQQQCS